MLIRLLHWVARDVLPDKMWVRWLRWRYQRENRQAKDAECRFYRLGYGDTCTCTRCINRRAHNAAGIPNVLRPGERVVAPHTAGPCVCHKCTAEIIAKIEEGRRSKLPAVVWSRAWCHGHGPWDECESCANLPDPEGHHDHQREIGLEKVPPGQGCPCGGCKGRRRDPFGTWMNEPEGASC